jgi:aspartate/methionine/tyrosine aminotransferase
MMPGPVQAAAVEALNDDYHVNQQRDVYKKRLLGMAAALDTPMPKGAFYLWMHTTEGDGWDLARRLAQRAGCIVSPGEFYGSAGQNHVRIAVVRPDDAIATVCERFTIAPDFPL